MTPTNTAQNLQRSEPSDRLSLSATQILASGLAAVSATVAASYFGIAGTVIGAGLGSVISVVGSAVYSYSIRQTRTTVRRGLDVAVAQRFGLSDTTGQLPATADARNRSAGSAIGPTIAAEPARAGWSLRQPRRLALIAGALFVTVLAATTGFELASGKPLAATVHGKQGSGLSLGGGDTSRPSSPSSSHPSSPAGSPASSAGTPSSSATVTVTVTPSGRPSPSGASTSAGPSGTDGSTSTASTSPAPTPTPSG